jgi:hypothetical protein
VGKKKKERGGGGDEILFHTTNFKTLNYVNCNCNWLRCKIQDPLRMAGGSED